MAKRAEQAAKAAEKMQLAIREQQAGVPELFAGGPAKGFREKLQRRGLPRLLKPGDFPIGKMLAAEILGVSNGPKASIKGKVFRLRHASGREFCFPVTGFVRNALAPGQKNDSDDLEETLGKEIGKWLVLLRNPDQISPTYKKPMFDFEVYTADTLPEGIA